MLKQFMPKNVILNYFLLDALENYRGPQGSLHKKRPLQIKHCTLYIKKKTASTKEKMLQIKNLLQIALSHICLGINGYKRVDLIWFTIY